MTDQFQFDAETAEQMETFYMSADVLRRRHLAEEALAGAPGERLLDIGCGPGFFVADLAETVGDRGHVTGIDPSLDMLAAASRRNEGRSNVTLMQGEATRLPVEAEAFDAALSVQVFEYVDDIAAALAEIHRTLRSGGRIVLWDVDWSTVSWHSREPRRMARVLRAWEDHLVHPSLPRTLAVEMEEAGLVDVRVEGHAFVNTDAGQDGYSGGLLPFIREFVPGHAGVTPTEATAWMSELHSLSEAGRYFFSCTQFCFTATKP